jgi:hypothetical protein
MKSALVPLASALALFLVAGCDRKPEPTPAAAAAVAAAPFERREPITWDDAAGVFIYAGAPLTAGRLWRFEDGPQGFTGAGSTLTFSPLDGVHLTNTAYDSLLRSPDALALDGSRFNLVLVRLGRVNNGPPWDGSLMWSTAAHGEAGGFMTKPFLGGDPALNETVVLAYDMAHPRKGGDDWIKSVVRQIRIDTDDGAGGRFILRQIAIVQTPAPAALRAPSPPPAAPKPAAMTPGGQPLR